uniref:Uncharacterized protein n=1 Tax=Romanomermis culicivorax TaxID=13658 RepID=A0A915JK42_ROMCU
MSTKREDKLKTKTKTAATLLNIKPSLNRIQTHRKRILTFDVQFFKLMKALRAEDKKETAFVNTVYFCAMNSSAI